MGKKGKKGGMLEKIKEAYKISHADSNCADGKISKAEFLKNMGYVGVHERVAEDLFRAADVNSDGVLDAEEFIAFLEQNLSKQRVKGFIQEGAPAPIDVYNCEDSAMQALLKTFRHWDANGDGQISLKELTRVIMTLNPGVTEKDIKAMLKEADKDKSGSVDFCEFIDWLYADKQETAEA
eukprot:gnl/MRDRNA2_/MRDRNA2_109079_c0_seq1.p1 gnl/MRDRNA2_/MRDRNA2_109079_c0~~gnl/MRDRNA2_/MRDRNA2_109079_c0_seq1.p1  ORF type:complete len:180 (+),score=40.78 gnl/MRDRNA2_/MRDRNA2_109079_c0_seq1:73-612(+)